MNFEMLQLFVIKIKLYFNFSLNMFNEPQNIFFTHNLIEKCIFKTLLLNNETCTIKISIIRKLLTITHFMNFILFTFYNKTTGKNIVYVNRFLFNIFLNLNFNKTFVS